MSLNNRNVVIGAKSQQKRAMAKEMRQAMTAAEALLWQRVRRNQCGGLHFRRQQVIDGFIADFYCHSAAMIVEVDGAIHNNRQDYDRSRDEIIVARGIRVLRFTNDRVISDINGVLEEICAAAT